MGFVSRRENEIDDQLQPAVGTRAFVTLPQPCAGPGGPVCCSVADVRGRRLVLHTEGVLEEPPPAGTPCLVGSALATRSSRAAAVVSAGQSMLVVDVAPDPRRHPRYGVACKVGLEVPGTELGAFAGILEDLSAGGMRVRTPVQLSPDQRVFVSIELPEAPPIQALAEVRGLHHRGGDDEFVARLQFTFMSSLHQGRLEALLEWPAAELGSMAQDNSRPAVALGGPT